LQRLLIRKRRLRAFGRLCPWPFWLSRSYCELQRHGAAMPPVRRGSLHARPLPPKISATPRPLPARTVANISSACGTAVVMPGPQRWRPKSLGWPLGAPYGPIDSRCRSEPLEGQSDQRSRRRGFRGFGAARGGKPRFLRSRGTGVGDGVRSKEAWRLLLGHGAEALECGRASLPARFPSLFVSDLVYARTGRRAAGLAAELNKAPWSKGREHLSLYSLNHRAKGSAFGRACIGPERLSSPGRRTPPGAHLWDTDIRRFSARAGACRAYEIFQPRRARRPNARHNSFYWPGAQNLPE